jgi:hypothetical protein
MVQDQLLREHREPHPLGLAVDVLGGAYPLLVEKAAHVDWLALIVAMTLFFWRLAFGVLAELQLRGRRSMVVVVLRQLERSCGLLLGGAYAEEQVEEPVEGLRVFLVLDHRRPQGVPHHLALAQAHLL